MIFGLYLLVISISAQSFQNGDILIGSGSSQILIYRNGNHQGTLLTSNTQVYSVLDMCFSTNKKYLFAANSYGTLSARITLIENGVLTDEILGNSENIFGSNLTPSSVVADAFNNVYVGTSSNNTVAPKIYKFNLEGTLLGTYNPAIEGKIIRSIDLGRDQSTLFYTDDTKIKRFDLANNTQLQDFMVLPENRKAFSVKLRSTNEILIASSEIIYRYNLDGRLLNSYSLEYCLADKPQDKRYGQFVDICLDADNVYFWAVVNPGYALYPDRAVKLKIDDGNLGTFIEENTIFSILSYGGRTAATTQCSDGIDNNGDGLIDYPDDPKCSSCDDNTETSCFMLRGRMVCLYKLVRLWPYYGIAFLGVIGWIFYKKRTKHRS